MKRAFKIFNLIWQFVLALTVLSYWNAPQWAFWILYGIVAVVAIVIFMLFITALAAAVKIIMEYVRLEIADEKSKQNTNGQDQNASQQGPGVDERK